MMEFHEKLQALRKQNGFTQEELAQKLYVSRTAVSKWESGRGYPNIDSLKALAKCFAVTVDDLLSGDEVLKIAEADGKEKKERLQNWVFGLLNASVILLLFLPLFGQVADGQVQEVSLLAFVSASSVVRFVYLDVVCSIVIMGVLFLALQNSQSGFWREKKYRMSMLLNGIGVLVFILGAQPYAAAVLFVYVTIQTLLVLKG